MSQRLPAVAATAALIVIAMLTTAVMAADINVISAVAVRPLLNNVVPQFERMTGHHVAFTYVTGPNVQREVEAGAAFDIAITNPGIVDTLINQGKIAAGTQAHVARAGVGVCGRAGAPKPDIDTVEAFKRALLNANSVSYSAEGTSGAYFLGLLDWLHIAADMQDKLRPQPGGTIPDAVAKGDAELCVTVMSQLVPIVPGAQLVGPVPAELQTYIGFTAGISANTKEPEAARSFVQFLTGPEVTTRLQSYGLETVPR
jgi:molybdate transport system substrate-binding protein